MEIEEEHTEKYKITKDEEFLLASSIFKNCRLNNCEEAVKAAEKLNRGTSSYRVLRLLSQIVGEDLSNDEFIRLLPTVRALYEASKQKDLRFHDIPQITFAIANATKWFQDEESIELERIRHMVNSKVKEIKITEASFLRDEHTREGLQLKKQGKADLRLSGTWGNRWNICDRWQKHCKENPTLSDSELKKKWIDLHYQPVTEETKNGKENREGATERRNSGAKENENGA